MTGGLLGLDFLLEMVDQSVENSCYFKSSRGEGLTGFFGQVVKISSDNCLGFQFHQGSSSLVQELNQLFSRVPPFALSDVTGHRNGSPSHLGAQPEQFIAWE